METLSDWMEGDNMPRASVAEGMVFRLKAGFFFVTHEGQLIGPESSRDNMITRAMLYLSSVKREN
jgi:hypothetical protein